MNSTNELHWLLKSLAPDAGKYPTDTPSSVNESALIALIRKHKVASHLQLCKDLPEIEKYPQVARFLKQAAQRNQMQKLLHAQEVVSLHKLLARETIGHLFLKGIGLSVRLYGDPAYRHSGDIDLLVAPEDARKVQKLLAASGYTPAHPASMLSDKQFRKNRYLSHHVTLVKRNSPIPFAVELHWYLTNPHEAFPLPTHQALEQHTTVSLGNQAIPVLSAVHSLVFNAYHGSVHQWFKLFWLKDFATRINRLTFGEAAAGYRLAKELKAERSYILAFALCHQFWGTPLFDLTETRNTKRLSKACVDAIETTEWKQKGISGKLASLRYRLMLQPAWSYKFALLWRLRTHYTDWEFFPLPDKLFFLYYPLRPFLLIAKALSGFYKRMEANS
ncbi:MAG: nucleotidyltransferase domain-containing protein [Bacteroidota bacterium]